ncbi:MAG: efflux RND transporter periplasmic adaptor subunit [Candidatus Methylacidiphilales bacterium]
MLNRRTKRAFLGIIFLLGTVLVILLTVTRFFQNAELQRRAMEEAASLKPRPPVVHTVARGSQKLERTYAAQVQPWLQSDIAAEVTARVANVHVEAGSKVRQGDLLISLDDTLARHQWKAAEAAQAGAEAARKEAERRLNEARVLAQDKVVSETELKAAESELALRESELARATAESNRLREVVERHEIRAPFDGVVNRRLVDPGAAVNVNQTVIHLVDLDPLRVIFFVNEQELPNFKPGQKLALQRKASPDETLEPVLRFIPPSADPQTGLFRLEAELPNPNGAIPAGLQANIRAQLQFYENFLFLPAAALRWNGSRAEVQRKQSEGGFVPVPVEVGPDLDGFYPVFSGLQEGDEILIR